MKVDYNSRRTVGTNKMTTEPGKETFTIEEELDFEVAKGLALDLQGFFSRQWFAESRKEKPNQNRLEALNKQAKDLLKEHHGMYIGNKELEAKARYVYGPFVRSLRIGGEPVWQENELDKSHDSGAIIEISFVSHKQEEETLTQDIDFELAKWLLLDLHGFFFRQRFAEKHKEDPNQERLHALDKQTKALAKENDGLCTGDEELEAKAIYVYGPIVRALLAAGEPVWHVNRPRRK